MGRSLASKIKAANSALIVDGRKEAVGESPDGRQFVFHSNRDGVQGSASEVELYLIDADGANLRRLTNNPFYDGLADW